MDPLLPSLAKLNRRDTLLGVLKNVSLEEVLEKFFSNKALHIVQKLETLLIGHVGESIVWAITFEDRVNARVRVIKTIGVHVLPKS